MEYADLHIHSHYSRATSKKMNPLELPKAAKEKGLTILGTGDFTHPKYYEELKEGLGEIGPDGFYHKEGIKFVSTSEISLMYSQGGKGRRIHLVLILPDLEAVAQLNSELAKWGRLDYDGRPIFNRTGPEVIELVRSVTKDAEVVPAHVWTPWFGTFGSMSGFDSLKEAFGDQAQYIHAVETGLSSDPEMNWMLSQLDGINLVSFSDAHSPYSFRLGREATVFNVTSYKEMINAVRTGKGLVSTVEVDPSYGKYHYDGHRNCGVSMTPEEAEKHNNICPVCGKPLTIGVMHRVLELADRSYGYKPENAKDFKRVVPLAELIAAAERMGVGSQSVFRKTARLISLFGSEFNVLFNTPYDELEKELGDKTASLIIMNREESIRIRPGYDGVYGEIILPEDNSEKLSEPQTKLGKFL